MDAAPHRLRISPPSAALPAPLYQQVVDAIKREINDGRLAPGGPLPSFRALAEELLVSLITVKRAYEDLEREGLIYRRQGLGTFVSNDGPERGREARLAEAREGLAEAVAKASDAGLTRREIVSLIDRTLETKGEQTA